MGNKNAPSEWTGLHAPPTGFEPVTPRLTVECSAVELWGKATNENYIRRFSRMSNWQICSRICRWEVGTGANFFEDQVDFVASWTSRGPSLKTKYNERTERSKELNPVFKKTDSNRSKLYTGFAGIAALALFTACGGDEPTEEEPADPGVEQEDPAQEDPAQEDPMGEDPAEGDAPAEGEDPAQEDPMGDETGGEEGAEIEGAGENNATSLVGLAGNAVSWAL